MNDNDKVADIIYKDKYLQPGESFDEGMARIAGALSDSSEHFYITKEILSDKRFLPAGRIQAAMGAVRETTPYNCFVSGTIDDSLNGITHALSQALQTLRLGGGDGYDFSTLRPSGDTIASLQSTSCGPVGGSNTPTGFMDLFDAGCSVIRSAGHRRGAQMGVLRVDHPDIRNFISAKRNSNRLTNFNISVGITDEFMEAVENDHQFELKFGGRVYERISAKNLWHEIMRSTWDWAEPGVLFLDTINKKNNLWYCETIAATNPCGEQPLPPHGACLLGSFNLTKYVEQDSFNYPKLIRDIYPIVRSMDNVVDRAIYPLTEQRDEALSKRRMGLGVLGFANASEMMGMPYGGTESQLFLESVLFAIKHHAYRASIEIAKEKGPFPYFNQRYLEGQFIQTLPKRIKEGIKEYGIRNSHLTSIAPTGSISLAAGNVSSGIEPTFSSGEFTRKMFMSDGTQPTFTMQDWGEANFGYKAVGADEVTAEQHVRMLNIASQQVDSAVSKTCNVGDNVPYEDFVELYSLAYKGGASGCTTFRASGRRFGILNAVSEESVDEGSACFIDPETGDRTCD